ncbi:PREDICTED: keratin-associated protein 13-1-like [Chrysochloris asiatica]|uniref:Keratin-associated protein n=1 Tax=Chrysochloris asiatica TaxID=185453 RepID=A0A9B0TCU0_CHRAS|nr:PREDICTED: keratin-associated protein 13-1-like [Chrysochloris asiatica]
MPYNCYSGNFSSQSLGSCQRYLGSSCGSSYPSNLVYSTGLSSPSICQLGSSLYRGCQETCCEPKSCQTFCVVPKPIQASCYRPRPSTLCSPCQNAYAGSLGFGSRSSCSLGYGSRSCYSQSCRSLSFRPLNYGTCGFPSLGYGSGFCYPTYFLSRSYQSSCYRPTCGSNCFRLTC